MLDIFADFAAQFYEAATLSGVFACLLLCFKVRLNRIDAVALALLGIAGNGLYHFVLLDQLPPEVNLNVPRVIMMIGGMAALALVLLVRRPRSFDRIMILTSSAALFLVTLVNHLILVEVIMEQRFTHHIDDHVAAFTAEREYGPALQQYCEKGGFECIILPRRADNSLAPHDHQIPIVTPVETNSPHHVLAGRVVDPVSNAQIALVVNYPGTTLLVRDDSVAAQLFYDAEFWFRMALLTFMCLWSAGMVILTRHHRAVRQGDVNAEEPITTGQTGGLVSP
ncbi:MAG: hypothetical protein KI792_10630 [Alphaproteobacteria bacterium]|nr:hypothetical protein [Alphaproteobacteria bacterium SS10]